MPEVVSEAAHATPGGPLGGLIAAYDGYRQRGAAPARHRGLPSPYLTMILTLDEPLELVGPGGRRDRFETLIGGLHPTPVVVAHDGAQSGIQLSLSPLAARALFGLPAGELAGLDLVGSEVIGATAAELAERMGAASSWAERFAELDRCLSVRLAAGEVAGGTPPPVIAAWARLNASGGQVGVAALAREVGWSERQLEKAFIREIGFSPKQAARVIRFDLARRKIQERHRRMARPGGVGALDLARLAADLGYHDQSHLIRDFRAFTGLAPTRWLAEEFGFVQAGGAVAA